MAGYSTVFQDHHSVEQQTLKNSQILSYLLVPVSFMLTLAWVHRLCDELRISAALPRCKIMSSRIAY